MRSEKRRRLRMVGWTINSILIGSMIGFLGYMRHLELKGFEEKEPLKRNIGSAMIERVERPEFHSQSLGEIVKVIGYTETENSKEARYEVAFNSKEGIPTYFAIVDVGNDGAPDLAEKIETIRGNSRIGSWQYYPQSIFGKSTEEPERIRKGNGMVIDSGSDFYEGLVCWELGRELYQNKEILELRNFGNKYKSLEKYRGKILAFEK